MTTLPDCFGAFDPPILQQEFARRAGVSETYMSDIMSGRTIPSDRVKFQIEIATKGKYPIENWARSVRKKYAKKAVD